METKSSLSSNDTMQLIGSILPKYGENFRDAIHVAVITVTASPTLRRGQKVFIWSKDDGKLLASPAGSEGVGEEADGIVDPFLDVELVLSGQRFLLCLFPRTITSLRHSWTHPAFDTEDQK